MPARPRIAPTEHWRQVELVARAPGQHIYELIRPVVRFGQSAAERAAETGAVERTLYRQVAPSTTPATVPAVSTPRRQTSPAASSVKVATSHKRAK